MRARIISGLIVLAGLAACQDSPPTTPGSLDITSQLELTGPSQIAPGETVQFRLFAINGGGTRRDVTSSATWTLLKSSIASIDGGLVHAFTMGDVTIAARFDLLARTQALTILAPGTYRLTGTVREQGLAVPVANATVQARGGVADVETVTGIDGRFTLYGAPSSGELRVTKPGYVTFAQPLDLQSSTSMDLTLQPAIPRPDFTGTYRLTITAAECKATVMPLPPELTQRTYTATVTQTADRLNVALSGADLLTTTSATTPHFVGTAEILGASFSLAAADDYYAVRPPDLVERVTASTVLVISGVAATTFTGGTLTGTLQGSMVQAIGNPFGTRVSQCVSNAMPFVMKRQ